MKDESTSITEPTLLDSKCEHRKVGILPALLFFVTGAMVVSIATDYFREPPKHELLKSTVMQEKTMTLTLPTVEAPKLYHPPSIKDSLAKAQRLMETFPEVPGESMVDRMTRINQWANKVGQENGLFIK